ncbi:MAG: peptide chain release factor 2 [Patescibacteria group bacterium]|jgi:peptide chain release factor 2|nr:peptide chain release factor 2 [Patescibacteria group bacterium]
MDGSFKKIEDLREKYLKLRKMLDIDSRVSRLNEVQIKMTEPGFWDDQEKAVELSKEAEELSTENDMWFKLGEDIRDLSEITALADKEEDEENKKMPSLKKDIEKKYKELTKKIAKLEFEIIFDGKHDRENVFLSIHAGTGGVDAQDWAEMLMRMYLRFAEKKNFKAEILDVTYGNEAGIKSMEMKISGLRAYGYLRSENGVHRLLRNSPFNSDGLRQTSFALVEVIPEIKGEKEINIKDEELRIDVYRSSGPGGQSVNTTDSAVRITHIPTGIVAACQNERSQHQNKEKAFKLLENKLISKLSEEREEKEAELRGEVQKAEWGKQIRSYFLYGNKLVKDHRTNHEETDVDSVLDGDIEVFISAYLRKDKRNN